jgi:SagB-type dehydrogenase family enzyme
MRHTLLILVSFLLCPILSAQDIKPIDLPQPQMAGGKPLMEALRDRQSIRSFQSKPLPAQVLSNLLWAAFGINRPDSGKRTAASARNWQEMDIYVVLPEATYVYDAKANRLHPVLAGDHRAATGAQEFVKEAPLDLVLVADLAKTSDPTSEGTRLWIGVDAGLIAQNVYLFCASEGLATVVRGSIDGPAFARLLKLRPDQKVIVAQTVGYPK